MPRLREVSRKDAPPRVVEAYQQLFGDRDPVAAPGTATGTPGNWWTVWALVPEVLAHAQAGFALLNRKSSELSPRFRELALTRTGFAGGSQFVFSQHSKGARRAGLSAAQVAALPAWQVSDLFDEQERAILAYVDALTLEHGRVQEPVFDALRTFLSDEAILELSYAIATYGLHATLSRALRLEYDDVPERVVEIPAPGAAGDSADIMRDIGRA